MPIYEIEYVETNNFFFGVEADNVAEAYERFEKWRDCSDHVYETMRNGWNLDSKWDVIARHENNDDNWFDDEDVLTDEMYKEL